MSQAGPLDSSRGASPTPMANKRASFVPLTGSPAARPGHRRISSVSDTTVLSAPMFGGDSGWPTSPLGAPDFAAAQGARSPPAHGRRMLANQQQRQQQKAPGDAIGTVHHCM